MLRVFFSISCGWWFLCILRFIKLFNCHQHSCTHPIYTQFMTFLWLRSQSSRSSPKTITTMCSLNFIFFLHNGSAQYLMVKSQFWAVGCWDLKEMRNNLTCFWNVKNCQTWHTFMGKVLLKILALSPFSTWFVFHTTSTKSEWKEVGMRASHRRGRRWPQAKQRVNDDRTVSTLLLCFTCEDLLICCCAAGVMKESVL